MQTINVLLYSVIAGIATLIGVMLVFYKERWARVNSIYLISFAAGIMLATAFIHIIPESLELHKSASIAILSGVLVFYLLQTFMMFHSHEKDQEAHQIGILALIGLTFHSLLDGVAIVAGFEASYKIGVLTTLAVLLHELPEGVMTTGILLHSEMKRSKILAYSTLVAVATPIGAIVSHFALSDISDGRNNWNIARISRRLFHLCCWGRTDTRNTERAKTPQCSVVDCGSFVHNDYQPILWRVKLMKKRLSRESFPILFPRLLPGIMPLSRNDSLSAMKKILEIFPKICYTEIRLLGCKELESKTCFDKEGRKNG